MNTYFEAYENADQKALDEIACPNGVAYENMETCMEKYWSSDYADFVTIQYLHSYERKSI